MKVKMSIQKKLVFLAVIAAIVVTASSVAAGALLSQSHFMENSASQARQTLFIIACISAILGIIAVLLIAKGISAPIKKTAEIKNYAEQVSDSKNSLLINISAEMRTPIDTITGLAELELNSKNLKENSFNNLEKIYTAGMTLLGIVNDILDNSKVETGKFSLIPMVFDVPAMIDDAIKLNIGRIGGKPIQFRLHLDDKIPARLRGDELRAKQIFNSLLSNAFKYTDSGYVDWSVSCVKEGEMVKVTSMVKDTGPGIGKEDLAALLNDSFQDNKETNSFISGMGLGISASKRLVSMMGGSITAESELGKGSVFKAEFYMEFVGSETIGEEAARDLKRSRHSAYNKGQGQKLKRADMSCARILVVDDVVTNLAVAKGILKPYGMSISCVKSGQEAIDAIMEERVLFDAILMDHLMPGMNGIEAVKIIRNSINSDYARQIPIIAVTASDIEGNDAQFLENGFQACLTRPIDIFKLDLILNQWLGGKILARAKADRPPAESAGSADDQAGIFMNANISGLNIKTGLACFDNDESTYIQVLKAFTENIPGYIEITRKMRFEIDADQNIEDDKSPLNSYRIAVHSIKGSCLGIGAETLGEMAGNLERAAKGKDISFIEANSGHLIDNLETLIQDISIFLQSNHDDPDQKKQETEGPSQEMIKPILEACEKFDIDSLKKAITTLDTLKYREHPGLADWLRGQAGVSNFAEIQKRLESL